ncbi:gliding motility lipoprotein GldH [Tamlana agarivorans]|uniref:Gliding motility lipoprotein GldH n=1 Tax=Pseudotamlana agarivorans TaxID=481183 RepID=A0ACC5U603_9FLAO|nr:gliding motility lipoprotein GldH [Tamlana agarivorans]MBU2949758.1 gliding motility lipoprotein GldH [Tamlana agarivorans]
MLKNRDLLLLVLLFFSLVSCNSQYYFDEYKPVPKKWHKDSIVSFKIIPPDSINLYNLFVNLRNTSAYKYSNLFLIVEMAFPHGKIITDTLEYKMAEPSGKFLGTGYSDIKENKLWYKEHVIFSESGEYEVKIQQAMRENGMVNGVEELEGITDVGFSIEHKRLKK